MSLVCAASTPAAELFNEGLEPGVRVMLDDQADEVAIVCFAEADAAYAHVRIESTGQHLRLASWRLARLP